MALGACYCLTGRMWLAVGWLSGWFALQAGIFGDVSIGSGSLGWGRIIDVDWMQNRETVMSAWPTGVLLGVAGCLVLLVARSRWRTLGQARREVAAYRTP